MLVQKSASRFRVFVATHTETIHGILDQRLLPAFGEKELGSITRADLLEFHSKKAYSSKRKGREDLSPSRVNHIMTAMW